jgi:hypothetical protein
VPFFQGALIRCSVLYSFLPLGESLTNEILGLVWCGNQLKTRGGLQTPGAGRRKEKSTIITTITRVSLLDFSSVF